MTGVAHAQLKAFVERIERLNDEIEATQGDRKEVYSEAKGQGFDVKTIRKVVALRKQDQSDRDEQAALLDLYMNALGEGAGLQEAMNLSEAAE